MDKTGIHIDELRYVEDFESGSGGQCEMIISRGTDDSVIISTVSTKNDVQHDFSIKKDDWMFIKQAIDRHLKAGDS